jgi:hypothetical protein
MMEALHDFLAMAYQPVLQGERLEDNQHFRVYKSNETFSQITFFDNIEDLVSAVAQGRGVANTYFTLSTTNGESGKAEALGKRTVLAFDFDKKDDPSLTVDEVMYRFKCLNLYFHALVDSGHGFHAYMYINPETDHNLVEMVQREIAGRLHADMNATKQTQIMRVPGTMNVKGVPVPVRIVKQYQENIRRYDIKRLQARFCMQDSRRESDSRAILANIKIPHCIEDAIRYGTPTGSRNVTLMQLVVALRERGRTLGQIMQIASKWNAKSAYNDNLEYRVRFIFEHQKHAALPCEGCTHAAECWIKPPASEFDFPDEYGILDISERTAARIVKGKTMSPYAMILYSILRHHHDGLTFEEVMKEASYKGQAAMGERTAHDNLNDMIGAGIVQVDEIGPTRRRLYSLKEGTSKPELILYISTLAVELAIRKLITPAALRLYVYMRYAHNRNQREDPAALQGNLFQYNQVKMAEELGVTQSWISQMVKNLMDERLLSEWYRGPSRNNGFDYVVYRLRY